MNESVHSALCHRIRVSHLDLIGKYGIVAVMQAVDDCASFMGELDEIGSSDVSCWMIGVIEDLKRCHPDR